MKHQWALRLGTSFLIVIIVTMVWASGAFAGVSDLQDQDIPTIDPKLLKQSKTSESLDYLIYFEEKADLSGAYDLPWSERGWYVYETLTHQADVTQSRVISYLQNKGVAYQSFWAENAILVEESTSATLNGLLSYKEIDTLQSIPQVTLIEPVAKLYETEPKTVVGAMSNLVHIQADDAWATGATGLGMVVGSIDTGVRFTHEALDDQYRGLQDSGLDHNFNWWDAVGGVLEPYDDHGHGSHTTGIMVGTDGTGSQIGVAPGAEWIACKGLPGNGAGTGFDLLVCGQFMLAPWDLTGSNPNPDLRPNVVNNSWGDCGQSYNRWYEGTIDAWVAAGIYPVFANGNAGNCGYPSPPGLDTVGNPARSYHVTAVGSTGTDNGQYAPHSNWGPTDSPDTLNPAGYATLKPQVVAPGVGIRSAVSVSDSAYSYWGGTSMSAPHVAGLIALMWEAGPCLTGDYVTTESLLQQTATGIPYDTGQGDEGPGNVPNHATGWGEIDALAAVVEARILCGAGNLKGHVVDASTQQPIAGARVEALAQGDPANSRSADTDGNGFYNLSVNSDEIYDLSAAAYGFITESVTDVALPAAGTAVTTDFSLAPNTASVTLSGTVSDGSGHGYPLYAHILVETGEHSRGVFTNPFDGSFEIVVYEDMIYDLTVTSIVPGYETVAASGVTFTGDAVTEDYALVVREICDAPGYDWVETGGGSTACEAGQGAVVAGFVTEEASGTPVNGAVIASAAASTASLPTPGNPDLPDGFYWLYLPMNSSSETIILTLSKGVVIKETVDIEVVENKVHQYDFALGSFWDYLGAFINQILAVLAEFFSNLTVS